MIVNLKYIVREFVRKTYFLTVRKIMPNSFVYARGKLGYSGELQKRIKKLEKNILSEYKETQDSQIKEVIRYIYRYGITGIFPYSFPDFYIGKNIFDIKYDCDNNLYYAIRNGYKLYLNEKFKNWVDALSYYKSILNQEHEKSPHKYLEKNEKIGGDWLIDAGGAEGYFALDHVNNFAHTIILEPEKEWIRAMNKTFLPWKNKVYIVNKCLGDIDTDTSITLDTIREKYSIRYDESVSLKMDIEGAELAALHGGRKWLEKVESFSGYICAYHNQNDENEIRDFFTEIGGYKIENTKGFMTNIYDKNQQSPWLRRGVLRIKRTVVH